MNTVTPEHFAMTDDIAERVRKIGGTTLRSIGHTARITRVADNDADYVRPKDMLSELWEDNKAFVRFMKSLHVLCDDAGSLLENWIDEAQRRSWFLHETCRGLNFSIQRALGLRITRLGEDILQGDMMYGTALLFLWTVCTHS